MSLLETKTLSVAIGRSPICTKLDFRLERGEAWGLLGGNGIGKTTLLNTLAGLHAPVKGEVLIEGRTIGNWKRKDLARKLGMLFQDSIDTFPTTVMETAMAGRYPHLPFLAAEGREDVAIVLQALEDVSLAQMQHRQVDTLSGGERRRLALAILLIQDPSIWLLDEPANHLDLHHQISLLGLVRDRVQRTGGALVMVLHDINLLARFCTHAMLMIDHETLLCGPLAEVLDEGNLARLYRHPVRTITAGEDTYYFPG